jgi:pilus assembly protein Flp/PilA
LTFRDPPDRISLAIQRAARKKRLPGPSYWVKVPGVLKKEVKSQKMLNLYWKLRSLTTRQEGQGMVEYALILVLVSIVVIVILLTMGNQIKNVFSNVVAALG